MAYSTISKPSLHFNTKLYTGTGSGNQSVTGVGFQPDFVWTKNRASAYGHNLYDVVRGTGKYIASNSNAQQQTSATSIISFDSDGFTVGTGDNVQYESASGVSWNWKAGGGQGSSNTDGSLNTTYTSVNTTAGFSISQYTGTGANATVGHGLGVAPSMILIKNLISSGGSAEHWVVYHKDVGPTKGLYLNLNNAQDTSTAFFNNTAPTNSVFYLGNGDKPNKSGEATIAYCFAEKKGYSRFGSYTGNGNADGTFVYTGFKPAWLMIKRSSNSDNWYIKDNKRSGTAALQNFGQMNPNQTQHPSANNNSVENKASAFSVDILSNGFKCRGTDAGINQNAETYVYMAFAEEPLVANVGQSIPATAR